MDVLRRCSRNGCRVSKFNTINIVIKASIIVYKAGMKPQETHKENSSGYG